jgi:uncharacterized membrane protein YhaH (DUF805 family)
MFKNPFSFTGRIRRTEYGLSYIMFIIFSFIAAMLIETLSSNKDTNSLLFLLIAIPGYGPNPKEIGNTNEIDQIGDYLPK